jgi:hypothetical protein
MRKKAFEPATKAKPKVEPGNLFACAEAIASGVMDWVAADHEGRLFYGHTQAEAEKSRATYHK